MKNYIQLETLILSAVKEVVNITLGPGVSDATSSIPLSNNSVSRTDEMASDTESKPCINLQTIQFALQFDWTLW